MVVASLFNKLLEAWHSIRDPNAIIEHIYIPDIYKALGNPKWRFCDSFKALICICKPFYCWRRLWYFNRNVLTKKKAFSQWQQFYFLECFYLHYSSILARVCFIGIVYIEYNREWVAFVKHSFAFVSHFIAEEGYSILTETFSHKSFSVVSDNNFSFKMAYWGQVHCSQTISPNLINPSLFYICLYNYLIGVFLRHAGHIRLSFPLTLANLNFQLSWRLTSRAKRKNLFSISWTRQRSTKVALNHC